jgi:hypothetical protein
MVTFGHSNSPTFQHIPIPDIIGAVNKIKQKKIQTNRIGLQI